MAKAPKGNYSQLEREFSEWLTAEGLERNVESIGIFAMRVTNFGKHHLWGYSEKGICIALGGDPYFTD